MLPTLLCWAACALPQGEEPAPVGRVLPAAQPVVSREVPKTLSGEEIHDSHKRAIDSLLGRQNPDGSWGAGAPDCVLELGFALETYYSWQVGAHALGTMALAAIPETPERRIALDRAIHWLCTTRPSTRGSDWDNDRVWSTLYGFVACMELLDDKRFQEGPTAEALTSRGKKFMDSLLAHQSDMGGWAYYDDPPYDRMPTWATSFCTALVLPSMVRAEQRGWAVEKKVNQRALSYVARCELPGGAYEYDLNPRVRIGGIEHINRMEGSLGRTQVGNWARIQAGDRHVTPDSVREGLAALFRHHGFLDHARTRPVPHEGFHANAGYFYYFAHYYAAKVINTLPKDEQEEWHAQLRPHITKTQWKDGSMSDFMDAGYAITSATAFAILTLEAGLR
ncbi:MAG: hypothetical protein OSB42_10890 [Planctomycetota bacterium]|nr:hypothetical protein [Planctomycetota bacterium]